MASSPTNDTATPTSTLSTVTTSPLQRLVGFELAAGRQLPSAESGVVWTLRDAPGVDVIDGGVVTAALVPLLVLAVVVGLYAAVPSLAGSWSGNLVRRNGVGLGMALVERLRARDLQLAQWIPEPSRARLHPYAWDCLFFGVPVLYVRRATRGYQSGNVKPSQAKPPMANGVSFERRGSRTGSGRRRK